MIHEDKDALICDLAETYGIYDMGLLPARTVATLSAGLRENSRIKMKLTGAKASNEIMLLAHAVDRLSILIWQQTKDGAKNRNKPQSIVDQIMYGKPSNVKCDSFDTPEEFWSARERILKGGKHG